MNVTANPKRLRTRGEIVRRRRQERQFVFFSVIIIALVAVTWVANSVYSGRMESPINVPFVTPSPDYTTSVNLVCPPADSLPLAYDQVGVRILNGTDTSKLAGNTLNLLKERGFVGVAAANYSRGKYDGVARIMFGEQGVQQAYTLATQFESFELIMDTRSGTLVDVVLGEKFQGLMPRSAPELRPDLPLTAPGVCVHVSLVQKEPAPAVIPENPLDSGDGEVPEEDPGADEAIEVDEDFLRDGEE